MPYGLYWNLDKLAWSYEMYISFFQTIESFHFCWLGPLEIIVIIYLLYRQVGLIALLTLIVTIFLLPVQVILGLIFGKLRWAISCFILHIEKNLVFHVIPLFMGTWIFCRMKIGAAGDKRINLMNQIIAGMRVIKMYCWEKPFSEIIFNLRR